MAPRKTTTRPERDQTKGVNDSDTLKDDQAVKQNAEESVGSVVAPGDVIYQTSQFDTSGPSDTLAHLADPPEAAVKAQEASKKFYREYGKKG